MITTGNKKLFLIDAYALIYRAYFAFSKNPRLTSKGFDTSAIYGFTNMIVEVINKEKPSHLGVVFDTPKKTHRHIEYVEYKANRDAMPEGISTAIPYIKKILDALNIPVLFLDGFEADDVIGTLSRQAEGLSFTTYMMTPDKDFAQLVTGSTFMYRPGIRGNPNEIWDQSKVCEKFGIDKVRQVIDFLGMVGDTADNIPGIIGIGPKTASKLLKKHHTIECIYESIDGFEGKLKDKIIKGREQAFLSKKLATIITDAPIKIKEDHLKLSPPNLDLLKDIFLGLEFNSIFNRVSRAFSVESESPPLSNFGQLEIFNVSSEITAASKKGVLISNIPEFRLHVNKLKKRPAVSLYVLFKKEKPIGLSISYLKDKSIYVIFKNELDIKSYLMEMTPLIQSKSVENIFLESKPILTLFLYYGIEQKSKFFDITLADYLINPDSNRSPSRIAQKNAIDTINFDILNLDTEEELSAYLVEMSCFLFKVKNTLAEDIKKQKMNSLLYNVELPLVNVLLKMEKQGVLLDTEALAQYSKYLTNNIVDLEQKIYSQAGQKFNVASPKQLGDVLFVKMALVEKPKKTKSGQFSTNETELLKLKGKHSIIDNILLFRTYNKLLNTYVDTLPLLIHDDQKIHTTFTQTVTNTGRLSSRNPNLQNIPIRKDAGKDVRKAFIPSTNNHIIMSADYSQIELRLIAELSNEDNMIDAFLNDKDIHSSTASNVFKVSIQNVTAQMRSNAKIVNFGIIYGVSAFGLSEQSTLSRKEASELIKTYFSNYPKLKLFIDNQINFARNNGYVETILGRKRYLRNINSRNSFIRGHDERNAVNMPVQGSAADIIKLAMISIDNEFGIRKLKSKMILQVHDELVFDVYKKEQEIVKSIVRQKMETVYATKVPLKVDIGFGSNWLQAH